MTVDAKCFGLDRVTSQIFKAASACYLAQQIKRAKVSRERKIQTRRQRRHVQPEGQSGRGAPKVGVDGCQSINEPLQIFRRSLVDHIDILCQPGRAMGRSRDPANQDKSDIAGREQAQETVETGHLAARTPARNSSTAFIMSWRA